MAILSIQNLLEDLPIEPVLALGKICEHVDMFRESDAFTDKDYRTAVVVLTQYARRFSITLETEPFSDSWRNRYTNCYNSIDSLLAPYELSALEEEAEREIARAMSSAGDEPGFAVLSAAEKKEILEKAESIREIIQQSELSTRKKNFLIAKLTKFTAEVAKDGTDTDAFFAFMGEFALNIGLMAKNAKPAVDNLKDILRILGQNRAKREGIALPGPDILRLPGEDS